MDSTTREGSMMPMAILRTGGQPLTLRDSRNALNYMPISSTVSRCCQPHANGKFTLGENLVDHGGLQVSFNAYKNATKGKKLKDWDGFTPDQRFFLAYAGVWASNITKQEIEAVSTAIRTPSVSGASTVHCLILTHGTRLSMLSPPTRCIFQRTSACNSGNK